MTKTLKKCQIWPFQLVKWANMVKIIKIQAQNEFQRVLAQKIKKKLKKKFCLKIHHFSEKIFKMSKIPLFGPRNPLGWASHVFLG